MKALAGLFCIGSLLAVGAYGQRGGSGGFGGSRGGSGRFHGGVSGFRGHGFAGSRIGVRASPSFGAGFGSPFGLGGTGFWSYPLSYPALSDAGSYDGMYAAYPPAAPNVTVLNVAPPAAPPPPPAPPPTPEVTDYHWDNSAASPVRRQVFFLVALKDGTLLRALAYWVDDDAFHYINQNGRKGQAPLEQIDRARSTRMNRDRAIEFGLPDTE